MKKLTVVLVMLFVGLSAEAQKKKRNAKLTLQVNGTCIMCKKRIEKAALNAKGVKFANFNIKKKELKVIINQHKTNKRIIQQKVANVGHDTKDIKAPQEVYDKLRECCKYRAEDAHKHKHHHHH